VQSASQALVALGRRLAAFAGALTALLSLLAHVPVRIACLRGAVAYAVVLVVARGGRWALERSLEADRTRASGEARS
jgi:hypothetical protein